SAAPTTPRAACPRDAPAGPRRSSTGRTAAPSTAHRTAGPSQDSTTPGAPRPATAHRATSAPIWTGASTTVRHTVHRAFPAPASTASWANSTAQPAQPAATSSGPTIGGRPGSTDPAASRGNASPHAAPTAAATGSTAAGASHARRPGRGEPNSPSASGASPPTRRNSDTASCAPPSAPGGTRWAATSQPTRAPAEPSRARSAMARPSSAGWATTGMPSVSASLSGSGAAPCGAPAIVGMCGVSGPTCCSSSVRARDGSRTTVGGSARGSGWVRPNTSGRTIAGCRTTSPGAVGADCLRLTTPRPTTARSCPCSSRPGSLGHHRVPEQERDADDRDHVQREVGTPEGRADHDLGDQQRDGHTDADGEQPDVRGGGAPQEARRGPAGTEDEEPDGDDEPEVAE